MKRITTLLLAVAFALGSVSAAYADGIDVKVKGQWDFTFGWISNGAFKDSYHGDTGNGKDDDKFRARHRIRTQINFITSEYLQGVLMFEIGNLNWGRGGSVGRSSGAGLDADGVNVETKRAYLDWIIPHTEISVRMGIQGLKLPSTPMGSPIFDADVAGVVVSSPITEWLSATAFWIRPFDAYANDEDAGWGNRNLSDEVDAFGLLLPVKGDGWSLTPWGIYGFIGASSGVYDYLFRGSSNNTVTAADSRAKIWWVGSHLELSMFDPLTFNLEAIYGKLQKANLGGFGHTGGDPFTTGLPDGSWVGASGWFLAATLDYKLDWGTPGVFGWWASGDKANSKDDHNLGRIPVLGNDGGSFYPTSFGTAGGVGAIADDGIIMGSGAGTWGVGIQLASVSFIEDLSHTLRVAYYRGTNHEDNIVNGRSNLKYSTDAMYLTNKDHVWEVNFDHEYKIYENLTAILELGYLNLKADKGVWGSGNGSDKHDDAWKAEVSFQYKF